MGEKRFKTIPKRPVSRYYRKPDGTFTRSQNAALTAWLRPGRKMERLLKPLGYRLSGFDPDYMFVANGRQTLYLSADVINVILKAAKR